MARRAALILFAATGVAQAQVPDVVIRADARLAYVLADDGRPVVRWYDPMGRGSWAGLSFRLEPGLRAMVVQRIQRIPGNADDDPLEHYYVENPGAWRVGKQPLPFGAETVFRDSVLGARLETQLALGGLPATVILCDEGLNRPRGFGVRIGTDWLRLSAVSGDHFAQSAGSLGLFRDLQDAPKQGSGYRTVVGIDATRMWGEWVVVGEVVAFRNGHGPDDPDRLVWDVSAGTPPTSRLGFKAGYTADSAVRGGRLRLEGSVPMGKSVWLEPMVRFRDGTFHDLTVSMRLKL